MRMLRQKQYHPLSQHAQVIVLVCAMERLFLNVPDARITAFRDAMLEHFEQEHPSLCTGLEEDRTLTDERKQQILSIAGDFLDKNAARFGRN